MLSGKKILLIIGGGIAAYKCLDLIRRIRERDASVQVILTKSAIQFVTPLSVATLSGEAVLGDLFDLTRESEIGHIELSRSADIILVAPATANLIAKMAHGLDPKHTFNIHPALLSQLNGKFGGNFEKIEERCRFE
ncbi:MAG: hypothetical protein JKY49_15435 [Cohaesibacteraceae bacterium]|nr:hypothetical protein [Cohaesibacteraceae bacterium]